MGGFRRRGRTAVGAVAAWALLASAAGAAPIAEGCAPADVERLGYVSNLGDDTISVINLETHEVVDVMTGFDYPFNQEIAHDGSKLYVDNARITNPFSDSLGLVDLCRREIKRRFPVFGPGFSSMSIDGRFLYDTVPTAQPIKVLDTATDAIIKELPALPGALHTTSYDGDPVWISTTPNVLYTVHADTGETFGQPVLTGGSPAVLRISPDGKWLISLDGQDSLTIVNTETHASKILLTAPFGNPAFGTFTPDGKYFWAGFYSGRVVVVDVQAQKIVKRIDAGGFSVGVNFSRDGKEAYVSTTPRGTVIPATNTVTLAQAILDAWSPGGLIQVYDTASYDLTDEFTVGNIPMLVSVPAGPFPCVDNQPGVRGRRLGVARLRTRRSALRARLASHERTSRTRADIYCVDGGGSLRVGYSARRAAVVMTTSTLYSIKRLTRGAKVSTLRRRLHGERAVRVGTSVVYLKRAHASALAFRTRGGTVKAIGLVDKRITVRTAKRLLRG